MPATVTSLLSSAYARSLGFDHDMPWPDTDESLAHAGAKQSKKDKRGRKKADRPSRVSQGKAERELCKGMAADAAIAMEERCGRMRGEDESKGIGSSAEDGEGEDAAATGGGAGAAAASGSSPAAAPDPPHM